MNAERLATCPNWPALLGVDEAVLYLGNSPTRLFALVAHDILQPWSYGHKDVTFLRDDIDTALKIVKINGSSAALEIPSTIKSVGKALDWRDARKKRRAA
jgi:hypothetical protein